MVKSITIINGAPEIIDEQMACTFLINYCKPLKTLEYTWSIDNTAKARKAKKTNTEATTPLNSILKVLSKIVMNLIRSTIEEFVSHNQNGFRLSRNMSVVDWTHWLITPKMLYGSDTQLNISGFGYVSSIDRNRLFDILKHLLKEDEKYIIIYLISETTIKAKIKWKQKR